MGYVRLPRAAAKIEQVPRRRRVSEKCNFKSSSLSSPRGVRRSYVEAGVASLRALMAPTLGSREARPTSRLTSRKGGQVALRPGARLARCCFGSPWCWVARTVLGGPRRRNAARVEPVIATAWFIASNTSSPRGVRCSYVEQAWHRCAP